MSADVANNQKRQHQEMTPSFKPISAVKTKKADDGSLVRTNSYIRHTAGGNVK